MFFPFTELPYGNSLQVLGKMYFEDATRCRRACRSINRRFEKNLGLLYFPMMKKCYLQITINPNDFTVVEVMSRCIPSPRPPAIEFRINHPQQLQGAKFDSVDFYTSSLSGTYSLDSFNILTKEITFWSPIEPTTLPMIELMRAEHILFGFNSPIPLNTVQTTQQMGVFRSSFFMVGSIPYDFLNTCLNSKELVIFEATRSERTLSLTPLIQKIISGQQRLTTFRLPLGQGVFSFDKKEERELGLEHYLLFEEIDPRPSHHNYGIKRKVCGYLLPFNEKFLLLLRFKEKEKSSRNREKAYLAGHVENNLEEIFSCLLKHFLPSWHRKENKPAMVEITKKEMLKYRTIKKKLH